MEYAEPMAEAVQRLAVPLHNEADLDVLLSKVTDRTRFVLLGEASHGTHEYYTTRARITKRLLQEKGFDFVAVEGDWPDCYAVNRFVKDYRGTPHDINTVLHTFKRWPTFMWANWEVGALAEWMRGFNKHRPKHERVGFYGLDVYSLLESLESIIEYLKEKGDEKDVLRAAEGALDCFERVAVHGKQDVGQAYGAAAVLTPYSCRDAVVQLLTRLRKSSLERHGRDVESDEEAVEHKFSAHMNARVAVDAEKYYQDMMAGDRRSWNRRDSHMLDTLTHVSRFYGPTSRGIIWAHNTHNGDARATTMAQRGEHNLGQLVREQYGEEACLLVGLSSYQGTVMAGSKWGAPMQVMTLPQARAGSWEDICHRAGKGQDAFVDTSALRANPLFNKRIGHRAVGVVFNPKSEVYNYVPSNVAQRYDAFIHLDTTRALHAIHIQADPTEVPDTYPFGV